MMLIVAISTPAFGMDFSLTNINAFPDSDGPLPYPSLLMKGEIRPGDYERLVRYAIQNNVNLATHPIILQSPGGDIAEALKIGRLVKGMYVPVSVGPVYGPCASACFIIYASAVERDAGAGLLGIHRPYLSRERFRSLSPGDAEAMETRALLGAENYLHELRVPHNLIDAMFESASTEIHWLSMDEVYYQLGKRAAWYEEFLIARCGLNKSAEERYLRDPDNNAALLRGLSDVNACGIKLTHPDAEKAFYEAVRPFEQPERQR